MSTPVGQPVPIQLVAADGATYLYAEAEIYLGSTLVTTLDLPHQSSGMYSADFTPTIPGHYSAVARFFTDPGHAVLAGYASAGGEFDVAPAGPSSAIVPGTVLAETPAVTPEEPLEPEVESEGLMGVYPGDLILRTAIESGIKDLRAHPEQLDDVFHWLRKDDMTADSNGAREADRAKQWFLSVHVRVAAEHVMTAPSGCMVSVVNAEESEAETTLADLHYDVSAPVDDPDQNLAEFAAVSYYPSTGVLVMPDEVGDAWPLQAGMLVVDRNGGEHRVEEVLDDSTVILEDREVLDFSRAALKLPVSRRIRLVESQVTKEAFRVTCHVHGDPGQLLWLHHVVKYILTRYRAEYLELRGFERSTVLSGPFAKDERWGPENFWMRALSVTGYVRDVWARRPQGRVLAVSGDLEAAPVVGSPVGFVPDPAVADQGYTAAVLDET